MAPIAKTSNFVLTSSSLAGFSARPNVPIYNEDGNTWLHYPSIHLLDINIVQVIAQEGRSGLENLCRRFLTLQMNYQIAPLVEVLHRISELDFSDNAISTNRPSTIPFSLAYEELHFHGKKNE